MTEDQVRAVHSAFEAFAEHGTTLGDPAYVVSECIKGNKGAMLQVIQALLASGGNWEPLALFADLLSIGE